MKALINDFGEQQKNEKPVVLDQMEYVIWGSGAPGWGDPRKVCTRQFSKHLVWLCRKKSVSAAEAAEELHVPTVYVEEELEILRQGENGQYGLLRKLDIDIGATGRNAVSKYAINFILFDKEEISQMRAAYTEQIPAVCRIVSEYVKEHKEEYMAFPYLNRRADWNLILWQQVQQMEHVFIGCVHNVLSRKYFSQVKKIERPFHVYGYVDDGRSYGGGQDGVYASNICGYPWVYLENIYNNWIDRHFDCGHNVANDSRLQLAMRAVDGVAVDSLSDAEREHAAKAIECGYLYRDGENLYTKILVCERKDRDRLFAVTDRLADGYLTECAETVAEKLSGLIRRFVPEHLLGEWEYAIGLGGMMVLDSLVDCLVQMGILTPPENRLGAEGCWMSVEKQ